MSPSERRRRSPRRVPAHRVVVSVEGEGARASAQAVNLSAGGACLALDDDRTFEIGDELVLWMQFAQAKPPVPATGRVLWTASVRHRSRCGLEWTHEGPQRDRIGWLTGV